MKRLFVACVLIAGAAGANTSSSLRPIPREPIATAPVVVPEAAASQGVVIVEVSASGLAPRQSLRPEIRRAGLVSSAQTGGSRNTFGKQLQNAFKKKPKAKAGKQAKPKPVVQSIKGSVCGDPSIRGQNIGRIPAKIKGCGLNNGVQITEVSGVALTQHAKIDCTTAKALKAWVDNGVKPAVGRRGGGVKSLQVVAHYNCRTRNNQKGARISEHGRGKALDISAINLNDGSSMTVLKGWRSKQNGPALKQMHKAACGPFGTVLGPNANRFHQDHFHFDTARHGNGNYCR